MADFNPHAKATAPSEEKNEFPQLDKPDSEEEEDLEDVDGDPEDDEPGDDTADEPKDDEPEGDEPKGDEPKGDEPDDEPDKGKKPKSKEDDGEPPVRRKHKTAKDYIIERQRRKLEKANAKKAEEAGDDDDEVSPEDEATISKVVEKLYGPALERISKSEDEAELRDFLSENPDFKPYEAKIKSFMAHPSRAQVPVSAIAYEVAGKDLLKMGAKRAKAADEKVLKNRAGGGTSRTPDKGGKKSFSEMTPAEFEKARQQVLIDARQRED